MVQRHDVDGRADREVVVVDLETKFERETGEEGGLGLGMGMGMEMGIIRGTVMPAATCRYGSRCFAFLAHLSVRTPGICHTSGYF
jgi:hypothetical protein